MHCAPSLSAIWSLWTATTFCTKAISNHIHPRYTATSCGEQKVALYRGLLVHYFTSLGVGNWLLISNYTDLVSLSLINMSQHFTYLMYHTVQNWKCCVLSTQHFTYFRWIFGEKQDRQYTCNVTLRRVRAAIVVVEKQWVFHNLIVFICSLSYPACNAHAPYLSSVACTTLQYFSALSQKRYDFQKNKKKKLLSTKCVLISSTTFA